VRRGGIFDDDTGDVRSFQGDGPGRREGHLLGRDVDDPFAPFGVEDVDDHHRAVARTVDLLVANGVQGLRDGVASRAVPKYLAADLSLRIRTGC
jgi:hypothetical protein